MILYFMQGVEGVKNVKVKLSGSNQLYEVKIDGQMDQLTLNGKRFLMSCLDIDAPVDGTVYGTLLNYKGALALLSDGVNKAPYKESPKAPILYIKPTNTLIGYGAPIPLPSDVERLEIGACLGVLIGRTATNVSVEQALEFVAGYTIVNDVSVPHDSFFRPAVKHKARDGFCPAGPWIVDAAHLDNPDDLGIRVYINGELKQENRTSNLIRPISKLIADVTEFMTLHKGDTLLVGVPEGAPTAGEGDDVKIEIDGIGHLENTIVGEDRIVGRKTI
jgi:5-oxopent-3-ene-1,2,5-tricarboxylate decarboxylase/2-hydroxyhepta-2,4-diene-1,7-dioate isomerase